MMLNNSLGAYQEIDLLGLPGYFYCDKTHCTLRGEICLKRQQVNENCLNNNDAVPFLICLDCDQGKSMKQRME
jgi:hypothetical protein